MKSSVYRLYGPQKILIEVESGLYARDAAKAARERNKQAADGLCLSLREFTERSGGREGWHISAKSGLENKKY